MAVSGINMSSFNMRGFNCGLAMLHELTLSHCLIAVQQHWLDSNSINKLVLANNEFTVCGVSSMNDILSTVLLKGRPFGGVAFMWHSSIAKCVKCVRSDSNGRCIAITLQCADRLVLIINVYFPCSDNSSEYKAALNECIGCIEDFIVSTAHDDVMIVGDTNFPCDLKNSGYWVFYEFLREYGIITCDDLTGSRATYVSLALCSSSCIDHVFVSHAFRNCIANMSVIDCEFNSSDHKQLPAN